MSSLPNLLFSSEPVAPAALAPMLDVTCPVTVILGSGTISVRECMALVPSAVLRLKESAGDDVQVMVGTVPVARAEVVIVNERTAVRLTDVLKPAGAEER